MVGGVRRPTVRLLKKKLWARFAAYVKERDGGVCFTCGSRPQGAACQAGHFVSRAKQATLFDPKNCHVQCVKCNVFLKGNVAEYARRFLERYGREEFDALMARSDRFRQWKVYELQELLDALEEPARFESLYAEKYVL